MDGREDGPLIGSEPDAPEKQAVVIRQAMRSLHESCRVCLIVARNAADEEDARPGELNRAR